MDIGTLRRFWKGLKVIENGCWLWNKYKDKYGYGSISVDGKMAKIHRVSFEHFKGEIRKGLQIDHLCRVRHCANPTHLEAVTQRENIMRGDGICSKNAKKTSCRNGHEYNQGHVYIYPGGRRLCMTCQKLRLKERSNR